MVVVDLNADVGEGDVGETADAALMPFITSACAAAVSASSEVFTSPTAGRSALGSGPPRIVRPATVTAATRTQRARPIDCPVPAGKTRSFIVHR